MTKISPSSCHCYKNFPKFSCVSYHSSSLPNRLPIPGSGHKALVAYFPFGYPDLETSAKILRALVDNGADALEIGVPFSDPLADGPAIELASRKALANGVTVSSVIVCVRALRESGVKIPIYLMGYANPFLSYGFERLIQDAAQAGVDGFIVPDLPHDVSAGLDAPLQKQGLANVRLVVSASAPERIREIIKHCSGFVYLVASAGVTGRTDGADAHLEEFVTRLRTETTLPLYAGFGISTPKQAVAAACHTDGVIVGSAFVRAADCADPVAAVGALCRSFREALDV